MDDIIKILVSVNRDVTRTRKLKYNIYFKQIVFEILHN